MTRLCFCLALLAASGAQGAGVTFHKLTLGSEGEHGVFSVDLEGSGRRDIIGLSSGRIAIYRADPKEPSGFASTPEVLVTGPIAYYADAADVLPAKGKEILILTPTGVAAYAQENGHYNATPRPLIQCDTILSMATLRGGLAAQQSPNVAVLPWNFAFDANGDGLDDVLVPHDRGTDLYLQKAPGQFARPLTLGLFPVVYHLAAPGHKASEFRETTARSVRLEVIVPGLERRDVNGDGKPDLVCGAYWFAQKADGTFDTVAATLPPDLQTAAEQPLRRMDLNGDGRKDGIEEENVVDDPLNIVTRVRIFLADPNGQLPAAPTQVVVGQNILLNARLPVYDFNGDGALDFAMFKTDITVTEIAKWVRQSFGKIDGDLNFYLFDRKDGSYPRRPSFSKPIRMRFKVDLMEAMMGLVWERYLSTMMRFEGDFNGDGRLDLLVRDETNRIAIYLNSADPVRIYLGDPDIVLDNLPSFGGLALDDLNGDGATDVILYLGNFDHVLAAYISRRP